MGEALDTTLRAWASGVEPETEMTVTEWADAYRFLSSKASSEPGQWRTARTPYLAEIMDCLSVHVPVQRIVVVAGAQVGKTECGNNWIGYTVDRAPCPMLMVQPTLEMAKRASKQRITPMIEATPRLRERVKDPRSKDPGNTTFVKEFDGGLLMMTGANSAAGLRSMPIRNVFLDEVDEYPGDLEGQGDPVALAEKRTDTFSRRKILLTSTPTIAGLSRIEREYLVSDQRRYYIPCPHCGHYDFMQWTSGGRSGRDGHHHHIVFDREDPSSVRMCCSSCGELVPESYKTVMLERGEWRPTAKGDGRTRGYHIPALLSPSGWKSWQSCVEDFLRAKEDRFALKTWVNTTLGETYEDEGDSVDKGSLRARARPYNEEVPAGVGALTAAVDVQGDRLEVAVYGWGAGEESWLVAFSQFYGSPATSGPWQELDTFLNRTFMHESGKPMKIISTCVDSGGHHTEYVYRYCKARLNRRVFAVKGSNLVGLPLVQRPHTGNRYGVPLFMLCVDTGKDIVMSRLMIRSKAPGFVNLPDWVDDEFLAQLTAEKSVRKYVKGRGTVREWVKLRERNEALDLTVYALAALHICGPDFIRSLGTRASRMLDPDKAPIIESDVLPGTLSSAPQLPTGATFRRPGKWMDWRR
jgi:phage terminase large subunit GpA-like protein